MPGAPSSFLLLAVRPGAPSNSSRVLAPSSANQTGPSHANLLHLPRKPCNEHEANSVRPSDRSEPTNPELTSGLFKTCTLRPNPICPCDCHCRGCGCGFCCAPSAACKFGNVLDTECIRGRRIRTQKSVSTLEPRHLSRQQDSNKSKQNGRTNTSSAIAMS